MSGVVPIKPERPDEAALDSAYGELWAAIKQWRRHPEKPEQIERLKAAVDARDDALAACVAEDERQALAKAPGH